MISWAVQIREMRPASITIRRWREICRDIFQKVGDLWKREFLPDHFTPEAEAKYGYQKRNAIYQTRKELRFKRGRGNADARRLGPIALVYSGKMYRAVTRGADVKAYPSRVTITLPGPHYISGTRGTGINVDKRMRWHPKKRKMVMVNSRPNMGKELLTDTFEQQVAIVALIDQELTAALNQETQTITKEL